MKKVLLILSIVFLSCVDLRFATFGDQEPVSAYSLSQNYLDELADGPTYEEWDPDIGEMVTKYYWLSDQFRVDRLIEVNVEFRAESTDDWKLPQETLDDGYGDYEDFAILYAFVLERYYGWYTTIVSVLDEESGMMYVKLNNSDRLHNPITGNYKSSATINRTFSLEEALHIADKGIYRSLGSIN